MTVTLLQSDGEWRIGYVQAQSTDYVFTKADADWIMAKELPDAVYQSDDGTFYYYETEDEAYVFHRNDGYYELASNVAAQ